LHGFETEPLTKEENLEAVKLLYYRGQGHEMTMVECGEMRDKESQQSRRRADTEIRPITERSAGAESRPFVPPQPPRQRKGGRPWIENRRGLEGVLGILRSGAFG
jgi:hypothetical protein